MEQTGTTYSIEDEDHTLANALRFFLNKKYVWSEIGCLQQNKHASCC